MQFQGKTVELTVLISDQTPVNLLGRDALYKRKYAILFTPDDRIANAINHVTVTKNEELVYWLWDLSKTFMDPDGLHKN